jgi:hypothetical protein
MSRFRAWNVVFCLALLLSHAAIVLGADATDVWKKVLKSCARTDEIGKDTVFLGVSNKIGPGSVWRFVKGDGSIRLEFELSDVFPTPSDQQKLIVLNSTSACIGSSNLKWDVGLGLPFSIGNGSLSGDLQVQLSRARRVDVSVQGFAVDNLKEVPWLAEFQKLPSDSLYRQQLMADGRFVVANVVKVTGLKAVFTFGGKLSSEVQAKYKGKSVSFAEPTKDQASNTGKTDKKTTPAKDQAPNTGKPGEKTPESNTGQGSPSTLSSSLKTSASSNDPCGGVQSPAGDGSALNSPDTSANGITIHVDVQSSNQITLCVPGPIYLLAAYSKLVGGGMAAGPGAAEFRLEPASPSGK